jgi:hypothetical protein
MPKQDNEKVKRERKIKSTINLEKLTKIQKHDIFKGHTNKNQEIDKKKKRTISAWELWIHARVCLHNPNVEQSTYLQHNALTKRKYCRKIIHIK